MKFFQNLSITRESKLDFLISFYVFCIIVSELMGAKTFPIVNIFGFQLNGSVGMFLVPWIFSINDIVAEACGIKKARNMGKISIIMILFLIIFSAFSIALPPSNRYKTTEGAYDAIFSQSIRVSIASLIAMAISNFTDINIFWRLKKVLNKYGLWFRNNLSNLLAILLDTVIFMTLAFYAINKPLSDNFGFLLGIIIPYWLLKTFVSGLLTPVVYGGIKWLRK